MPDESPSLPYPRYLVAVAAEDMASRVEAINWVKDRGGVHILADVYLMEGPYQFAGDIVHELERYMKFQGRVFVLKLSAQMDWGRKNLSEEADAWIRKNLGE